MNKINLGNNGNFTYTQIEVSDDELIARDVMPGQYVQAILDRNHRLRSLGPNRRAHGRLAASIPDTVYAEWRKEWMRTYRQDWTWKTFLTMKLNNRDYSFLKTNEARL